MADRKKQFISLTPKAVFIEKLIAKGVGFGEALVRADHRFTSDGMQSRGAASRYSGPELAILSPIEEHAS